MSPKVAERLAIRIYTVANSFIGDLLIPEVDGEKNAFRLIDVFNNPRLSALLYETAMNTLVVENVVFDDGEQSDQLYLVRSQIVCAHVCSQYETFNEAAKYRVRKLKASVYEAKTFTENTSFMKERLTVRLSDGTTISGVYHRGLRDLCGRFPKTEFIVLSEASVQFPGETTKLLTFLLVNCAHIVSFI